MLSTEAITEISYAQKNDKWNCIRNNWENNHGKRRANRAFEEENIIN